MGSSTPKTGSNWINAVTYNDNGEEGGFSTVADEAPDALKAAILKNVCYIVKADGFDVAGAKSI